MELSTNESILVQLSGIVVLGIVAQWLAWRLRVPSIFILLLCGLALGPGLQILDPDALLNGLLLPIVSLSVAVILFEGGLNLRVSELHEVGKVVRNLVTVGCLITWLIAAGAAHYLLGLDPGLAFLFGAVLVVTGPTVTIPLLRHLRLTGRVGHAIKWEGIVNDPVGATLAVLVFEVILAGTSTPAMAHVLVSLLKTLVLGSCIGLLGAGAAIVLFKPKRLPDYLQVYAALALVLATYTLANVSQSESGLLAVTVMGIVLANQRKVSIRHMIEFKENLRNLLLSVLFIVLGARLARTDIARLELLPSLLFLATLVFVARPLAVAASTWGFKLTFKEKLFLCWIAPRGVVAAAVSSVFALELADAGHPQAEWLVPLTFLVVIGTVALYGLTSGPLARRLGLGQPNPQGVLIGGAHGWARQIAGALQSNGVPVLMVDTNWANVTSARMEGIPAHLGSIISDSTVQELSLVNLGRMIALTSNDEANALAALHLGDVFGRAEVYQISPREPKSSEPEFSPIHLRGRILFSKEMTYEKINNRFLHGAVVGQVTLTREFDFDSFKAHYGDMAVPLFLITEQGHLHIFSDDRSLAPRPGYTLISLLEPNLAGPATAIQTQGTCEVLIG